MTVKELKEKLAKLPEEYDNLPIKMEDPDYTSEYCGSATSEVDIDVYKFDNDNYIWFDYRF